MKIIGDNSTNENNDIFFLLVPSHEPWWIYKTSVRKEGTGKIRNGKDISGVASSSKVHFSRSHL